MRDRDVNSTPHVHSSARWRARARARHSRAVRVGEPRVCRSRGVGYARARAPVQLSLNGVDAGAKSRVLLVVVTFSAGDLERRREGFAGR